MFLSEYLIKKKMSIRAFARKVGLHHHTLHFYLNGEREPVLSIANRIAENTEGLVTLQDLVQEFKIKE